MKSLLIGADGAQINTFQRGWTPFIASLIKNGDCLQLKEDLVTRGWSEIVTGQSAINTGALYNRAVLNGTYEWNLKFSLSDIPNLGSDIKPLWQALNESGHRVGIMNVPITYPAPAVDGFIVSGGGGGERVIQTPTLAHCHPDEILTELVSDGYIVDERLDSLLIEKKLYRPHSFFSHLEKKNNLRTQAFIKLAKHYNIDFGFIVFKSSSNLAEFLLLPEWGRYLANESEVDLEFIEAIKDYYKDFDKVIKQLVDAFPGAEIMLVSDHSMATREWSVNLNVFLQDNGFQNQSRSKRGIYNFIKHLKKLVPFSIRQAIRNAPVVRRGFESLTPFDTETSLAFSMIISDNVRGIYINDENRFGGPVSENDKNKIIDSIVKAFNADPLSKTHGFSAHGKPEVESYASKYYPDIIVTIPDGYVTSNEKQEFVSKHDLPKGPLGISSVTQGNLLCGKAHHPIAVNAFNKWMVYPNRERQDLRLIYDHILKRFSAT